MSYLIVDIYFGQIISSVDFFFLIHDECHQIPALDTKPSLHTIMFLFHSFETVSVTEWTEV